MKFLQSTTDTLLVIATIALIGFTAFKITDPKDFVAFMGMLASYKFGRYQGTEKVTTPELG
jgi:hypothetical protein